MAERVFVIKTDDRGRCPCCDLFSYECRASRFDGDCNGKLEDRPDWCPLISVRKPNHDDIKSYKETWVEG